jgi:hypothetical protein
MTQNNIRERPPKFKDELRAALRKTAELGRISHEDLVELERGVDMMSENEADALLIEGAAAKQFYSDIPGARQEYERGILERIKRRGRGEIKTVYAKDS